MFPETLPFEVEVTGDGHKHAVGEFYGAHAILDALKDVHERQRAPGFALAMAIAERVEAEMRTKMLGLNLRAVAAAGHDLARVKNISLKGNMLICERYSPDEAG
jgi:hypothetical protein